jgi:hypothetical protein
MLSPRDIPKPAMLSNAYHPWPRNIVILPEPGTLHCIFLFVTLLWYATFLSFCCIALICYIAFVLLHCFDILHYHIALIWYIAILLWYTTHCYIAFVLLPSDYMNAYYIVQWWKSAKWDECGNMDQYYCTIKISASNNMKQIGHSMKHKSESIYMKFSSSLPSFCVWGFFRW